MCFRVVWVLDRVEAIDRDVAEKEDLIPDVGKHTTIGQAEGFMENVVHETEPLVHAI